jgi:eukaryotic-like serine/threonine-protein kinase
MKQVVPFMVLVGLHLAAVTCSEGHPPVTKAFQGGAAGPVSIDLIEASPRDSGGRFVHFYETVASAEPAGACHERAHLGDLRSSFAGGDERREAGGALLQGRAPGQACVTAFCLPGTRAWRGRDVQGGGASARRGRPSARSRLRRWASAQREELARLLSQRARRRAHDEPSNRCTQMKTSSYVGSARQSAASPELGSPYPQPGAVVDGAYRVGRLLVRGGTGAVFKATHLSRRTPVALKFIDPALVARPGWSDRFIHEAVAASGLGCEHIIRIFDVGCLPNGAPLLVMELLEGVDLEQRLAAAPGGRLEVAQAVHYVLQILRALQVVHTAGVVHGDLKPTSVFLAEHDDEGEGDGEIVKLLDFGVGRFVGADDVVEGRHARANAAAGTPLYIAPERARDPRTTTPRGDLYSVGAMLYEMLSGGTPFAGKTANEQLFNLLTQEPPPLFCARPDLPVELVEVVHRALAKSPEDRPASAIAFAQMLAPFADARSAPVLAQLLPSSSLCLSSATPDSIAPVIASAQSEPVVTFRRQTGRSAKSRQDGPVSAMWKRTHLIERWPLLTVAGAIGLSALTMLLAPGRSPSPPAQLASGGPLAGPVITAIEAPSPPPSPSAMPAAEATSVAASAARPSAPPAGPYTPRAGEVPGARSE